MISALQNDGIVDMKNYLLSLAVSKPWVLSRDGGMVTDMSSEDIVEQAVLESLLDNCHEEIPYVCDIHCTSISSLTPTRLKIDVNITVDNKRQKKIILGQQGRSLVKIRQASVDILEKTLKKSVILYLWIKARDSDSDTDNDDDDDTAQ